MVRSCIWILMVLCTIVWATELVAQVDCPAKKYCKDMTIYDEAKAYLNQCGYKNLDRDGDGMPC